MVEQDWTDEEEGWVEWEKLERWVRVQGIQQKSGTWEKVQERIYIYIYIYIFILCVCVCVCVYTHGPAERSLEFGM